MNQTPTRSPTGPPLVVVFFPYVAVLLIGPIGLWIGLPILVILSSGLALLLVGRNFGGFIALPLALWLLAELLWALAFLIRDLRPVT